jgi:hypothetical protein
MAQQFPEIDAKLEKFITAQRIFFTASATADSRVNVSPREIGAFRVLGPNDVAYLDRTGSGNETAAHLRADGRMTIMFCAFEGPPRILRLYGQGRVVHRDTPEFAALTAAHFPDPPPGTRQITRLAVEIVQTSCGYGVPLFDYQGDRPVLEDWARNKGPEGIEDYWREKNLVSMDGLPTGLME